MNPSNDRTLTEKELATLEKATAAMPSAKRSQRQQVGKATTPWSFAMPAGRIRTPRPNRSWPATTN